MGNQFPRWETISHGGKSISTVGFPACLASRHPSIGEAASGRLHKGGAAFGRPSFVDIPMDGCLEARQAGNPTVENDFPPWEMVSHRGKWFPTVGNHFPPWDIISHRGISFPTVGYHFLVFSTILLTLCFRPYKRFLDVSVIAVTSCSLRGPQSKV